MPADPRKIPLLDLSAIAEGDDAVLLVRDGVVQLVRLQKLPLSDLQSQAVADATAQLVRQTEMANAIAAAKQAAQDLTQATGLLETTKVKNPAGDTLEARLQRLEAGQAPASSSDPAVTADPVLSGTVGAGNDLTLTAGPVVAGSGGASSLDFGSGNTTRRLTTTSLEPLTDSTGWSVGVWWRLSGTPANEVMLGFGTGGAASSFQIRTFSSTEIGAQVRDASGANVDARIAYPAAGDYLVVAQYSDADGALRVYIIPKGGTVSGPSDSTVVALATVTPAAGWYIGSDGTNWTTRPIGEAFKVNRLLTNGELTSLAAGNPITSVLTPRLYWPLRNGPQATEANQGAATGADATLVGSSYATAPVFFGANPHKNNLVLRKTDANGVVSVLAQVVQSGTTLVYKQQGTDVGATITGTHTPIDSVTTRPGNTKTSNTVGPVTGTKPAGGTVTASPSGSQAAGGAFTANFGTGWSTPSGSNTYRGRWYLDGVAITSYSSASPAYTSNTQQAGGKLKFGSIATSGVGVDSDEVFSNEITLTGTASAAVTTPITLPAHLYLGVQIAFPAVVWNVSSYTVLGYNIRRNGVTTRSLQRDRLFTATFAADGAVVGNVFDFSEVISYNGEQFFSAPVSITLEDTPATFAAATLQPTVQITSGAAVSFKPTTATGGGGPLEAIGVSPTLPGSLTLATDGTISGSYGGAPGEDVFTVTWRDNSTGTTDTADFTLVIVSAGVTPLPSIGYPVIADFAPYGSQSYNGSSTVSLGSGSPAVVLQLEPDPSGSGVQTWFRRIRRVDWNVGPRNVRNEKLGIDHSPSRYMLPGNDYWMAGAFRPRAGEWPVTVGAISDEMMLVWQTHSESSGDTQPDIALYHDQNTGLFSWRRSWSTQVPLPASGGNGPGHNQTKDDQVTEHTFSLAPGQWVKFVMRYRPGWLTSHAPRWEVWQSVNGGAWTKVINRVATTDFNTYNSIGASGARLFNGTYPRDGFYKWSGTGWNANYATIAGNYSDLYWAVGTDLLENGKAAVAGI